VITVALPASAAPQQSLHRGGRLRLHLRRRQKEPTPLWPTSGPMLARMKGSVSDLADLNRLYAAGEGRARTLDIVFANAGAGSQLALGKIIAEHI